MNKEHTCRVTIKATNDCQYQKLKKTLINENGIVDFNKVINQPTALELATNKTSAKFIWLYELSEHIRYLKDAAETDNNNLLWKDIYAKSENICSVIANVHRQSLFVDEETANSSQADLDQLVDCRQKYLAYSSENTQEDIQMRLVRIEKDFNREANNILANDNLTNAQNNPLSINRQLLKLISNPENKIEPTIQEFLDNHNIKIIQLPLSYPGRILASVGKVYLTNYYNYGFRDQHGWRNYKWGSKSISNGCVRDDDLQIKFHITRGLSPLFCKELIKKAGDAISINVYDLENGTNILNIY